MKQGNSISAKEIKAQLAILANPEDAQHQARYFKTGPGEYAEGDQFLGIRVPELRKVARRFSSLSHHQTLKLLTSRIHEHRFVALLLLLQQYQRADEPEQKLIYQDYLDYTQYINNWDLVDVSAPKISGHWLYHHKGERKTLNRLIRSRDLWQRRIGVMSTFYFIREGDFEPSLKLAKALIDDPHDLIHKATGWMLREVGKRDRQCERRFLDQHAASMPRTMLRYAIEKFPQHLRQHYLNQRAGD